MPEPPLYKPVGASFIELQSIDSTNNYALAQVHAGLAQHGTSFFAHEQVAGRGQRGKTWVAEKDSNLILSVILDPHPLLPTQQFCLSACIAVSVCEFFMQYAGDDTCIKWPNDVYWQDRKAGGVLIENVIRAAGQVPEEKSGAWRWAVAGIGININQAVFPPGIKNPVSLRQITGKKHDPLLLAKELCRSIEKNWQILSSKGFEPIYNSYLQYLYRRGKRVTLRQENRVFEATVKTVTRHGTLIVEHSTEEEFLSGELEWIIPGR